MRAFVFSGFGHIGFDFAFRFRDRESLAIEKLAMTTYELFVINGSHQGHVYQILDEVTTIGRDRSCQICLDDPALSRHHARITRYGDELTIEDLSSVNGTFVNGAQVKTQSLRVNDRITLGIIEVLLRQATSISYPSQQPSTSGVVEAENIRLRQASQKHSLVCEALEPASMMSITQTLSTSDLKDSSSHSLETIYRITRMASSIFDLDVLLNKVLDEIFANVRAERAFILLIDPNSDQLEVKASRWQDKEGLDHKVSISQNIISHVLEKKESVLIADAMADSKFGLAESVVLHQIRSAMCSPLRGRTRIVGIIHVDTTGAGEFTQEDLMLLDAIGNAAGIAVENAQFYSEKIQNERLAAMGQAISGLSHYIKNIIGAMQTSHEMMEKGLDTEDLALSRRMWKIFGLSTQRIGNLALDMLAFSRERKLNKELCQVNDICREVVELCQDRIQTKKGRFNLALDPHLPQIQVDPQVIHRSLLNLVTNGIDALDKDGGEVQVSTSGRGESEVLIKVQDNGIGMPEQICQRVFDVFFTTKGDEGTGLGLAVTKKIIEEHGGRIEVQSTPGQGTVFSIKLHLETGTNTAKKGES
jgi:signal transduction histidine kinase